MKIGIDARFWNETGVGRYTRNLVSELQRIDKKNSYTLFVLRKDVESVNSQLSTLNFQLKVADVRWHTIREQLILPKILEKENLDLMHFPYFSVPVRYKLPYVITIHDLILHHFPTGEASTLPSPIYNLKHIGYKYIIEKAAKNALKIISVSEATKKEITQHLNIPPEKVTVINEGVDKSLVTNSTSTTKNTHLLHVGNLYPHKNMNRVLTALQICKDAKVEVKLVIVGRKDYFYQKFVNSVHSKGLDDSVIFKGEVTDAQLATLYQTSFATIVPSLMEGFGLPALEAMANNCLVLASNTPSLKEVCADTAIYFEPLDSNDMAEKIKSVMNSTEKEKQAREKIGYNRAQQLSWEKMGRETLKVYESCAGIRQSK